MRFRCIVPVADSCAPWGECNVGCNVTITASRVCVRVRTLYTLHVVECATHSVHRDALAEFGSMRSKKKKRALERIDVMQM